MIIKSNINNIIKFNNKIYPEKAVLLSIEAFKHLAHFQIKQKDDYFIVTLTQINPAVKNIIKEEFSNYVLAKTKQIKRYVGSQ